MVYDTMIISMFPKLGIYCIDTQTYIHDWWAEMYTLSTIQWARLDTIKYKYKSEGI